MGEATEAGDADSSLSTLPLVQKQSWSLNPANGGLQNLLDSILSLVRTLMMIKYPNMLNLPKSFEFGPEDFENQGFIDHCTGILSNFMIFSTLNFRSKIENLSHALFTPSCMLEI